MPLTQIMPSISFVVARSVPGNIIGCDNKLPWHLRTDLKNFKSVTSGHVIIMGRNTFDSIGHPLPNRINVVISSRDILGADSVHVVRRREDALLLADQISVKFGLGDIFVIGGGSVYSQFNDLFNKVYLTEVYAKDIRGDSHFDYKFGDEWKLVSKTKFPASETDEYPFAIKIFEKKKPRSRKRISAKFLKSDPELNAWEERQIKQIQAAVRA